MAKRHGRLSRRDIIRTSGVVGAACLGGVTSPLGAQGAPASRSGTLEEIASRVDVTPIIDTHEHLIEESTRLGGRHDRIKANDWSFLLSHYLNSDLVSSGMPQPDLDRFLGPELDPVAKWKLLEPYWPRVRHTGYGQAVEISVQRLYGVNELSAETVPLISRAYHERIRPGFYRELLTETAGIESCQVNFLDAPFSETSQPLLLMQDLSFVGMHMGPSIQTFAPRTGIEVEDLSDWHRVIDWWFDRYGPYAVAIKSQAAYSRNIDYLDVPAEEAEPIFKAKLSGAPVGAEQMKHLEDHLFWYCVRKATQLDLPVKLHTGYYAGHNRMPLERLQGNAAAAADLCRIAPDARFVFMHINYPFYEDLIAVSKHYSNCHIDMCWAWIISPVAGVNFLKQYLVTAPVNKVLTFGGDYIPVEPVVGHAVVARKGITRALFELVEEGWLTVSAAIEMVPRLLHGNAREIFRLELKSSRLRSAPWL